jgi:hypothetical protein
VTITANKEVYAAVEQAHRAHAAREEPTDVPVLLRFATGRRGTIS